jgi:DNA-binding NtrC family response regulator
MMSSLRILLVDDDKGLLEILSTLMELDGHHVVKATSAHAGLMTMREEEFDLVLADLKMPRTTGLDMLRAIREDFPDTKVVIMTAYASVNSTVEAMRLGVFDYLPKPFKLADLRTILDRVRRDQRAAPTPGAAPDPSALNRDAAPDPNRDAAQEKDNP